MDIENIKIGDRFCLRSDLIVDESYGNPVKLPWTKSSEKKFKGQECTAVDIVKEYGYVRCTSGKTSKTGLWITAEMIDHIIQPSRYEQICSLSVEEMAKRSLRYHTNLHVYFTLDGKSFDEFAYDEAVAHQIEWLQEKEKL